MRPLRLEFQAFGPFATRNVVDLTALEGHPLFGIYGPTGGGKTTVLDALSFVLFGESSGGERTPADLRSHYAPPDVLTYAELVFQLGGRTYLARREPTQSVKARRGDGMTTHQHAAWLFDATGLPLSEIRFPENPGQVIAEKKALEVNAKLTELLGYTKDQFRQILVLPQGAFREFLAASGKQRSEILKSLFDTAPFEHFTTRLKAERSELRKRLAKAETAMQTVLQGITIMATPPTNAAALSEAITTWRQNCAEAEAAVEQAERKLQQAKAALSKGESDAALFAEHQAAVEAMAGLERQQPDMAKLRKTVEAARRATNVSEAAARLANAKAEAQAAEQRVAEQSKTLQELEKQTRIDHEKLQASLAGEPERQKLAEQLAEQTRFCELLAAQQQPQAELATAETELARAQQALKQAQAAHQATQARSLKLKADLEELATAKAQLAERRLADKEIAEQLQAARALEENSQALKRITAELKQAQKDLASLETAHQQAAQKLSQALKRQHHEAARQLAAELVENTPCPVCGSRQHPAPAHLAPNPKQSSTKEPPFEDLQALQNTVSETLQKRQQTALKMRALEVELNHLERQRKNWEERTASSPSLQALEAAAEANKTALASAEKILANATALEEKLRHNKAECNAAESALAQAQSRVHELDRQVLALKTQIETSLASLPKELRDPQALKAARAATQQRLQQLQQSHQKCLEAANASHEAEQLARSRLSDAKTELQKRQQQLAIATKVFEKQLHAQGFADQNEYQSARLAPEKLNALSQELETYEQSRAIAATRLARAEAAIQALTPPDLEALQQAAQQAETIRAEAIETLSARRTELNSLRQAEQLYQHYRRQYELAEKEYRTVVTLAEIAEGQGLNSRRISLVNWVLGAYFEAVMAAANRRFDRMSKGRFELRRSREIGDKRGISGLDIVVFDAWTGQERPARTLSGGESFLAALALALGLSDVVQAEAGGVQLDAIFIDEGFGQLDEEALETALNSLNELAESARLIGLISHVDEVKQMVPAGFEVTRAPQGSQIAPRTASLPMPKEAAK